MFLAKNIFLLACVAVVYGLYVFISYKESFREHPYFWVLGLVPALVGSLLWTTGIKIQSTDKGILFFGLGMDTTIVLVSILIPFVLFNLRLNSWSIIGLALLFSGVIILKVSN